MFPLLLSLSYLPLASMKLLCSSQEVGLQKITILGPRDLHDSPSLHTFSGLNASTTLHVDWFPKSASPNPYSIQRAGQLHLEPHIQCVQLNLPSLPPNQSTDSRLMGYWWTYLYTVSKPVLWDFSKTPKSPPATLFILTLLVYLNLHHFIWIKTMDSALALCPLQSIFYTVPNEMTNLGPSKTHYYSQGKVQTPQHEGPFKILSSDNFLDSSYQSSMFFLCSSHAEILAFPEYTSCFPNSPPAAKTLLSHLVNSDSSVEISPNVALWIGFLPEPPNRSKHFSFKLYVPFF